MKTIALLFLLAMLASCNDALRTRAGEWRSSAVLGSNTEALQTAEFRKMYFAEVHFPILTGQSQIIFQENAQDSDFDQEMRCDLDISENKQFNYSFLNGKLLLKDGISTLILSRKGGLTSDGLIGTWQMKDTVGNLQTVTELIFKDLEMIRIKKTCSLK